MDAAELYLIVWKNKNNFSLDSKKKMIQAILTMAFNVSAVLVNCRLDFENFNFKIKRVLKVILNEINMYHIKYCSVNKYNLSLLPDTNKKFNSYIIVFLLVFFLWKLVLFYCQGWDFTAFANF